VANQETMGILVPLLPLAAFVLITFVTRKRPLASAGVSIAAIGASLALAAWVLAGQVSSPGAIESEVAWLRVGSISISVGVLLNPLTALMLMVVTVVSLLVQIYSLGYMKGDTGFSSSRPNPPLYSIGNLAGNFKSGGWRL
jgi:NADH-quinone oxidoreductase subunit L